MPFLVHASLTLTCGPFATPVTDGCPVTYSAACKSGGAESAILSTSGYAIFLIVCSASILARGTNRNASPSIVMRCLTYAVVKSSGNPLGTRTLNQSPLFPLSCEFHFNIKIPCSDAVRHFCVETCHQASAVKSYAKVFKELPMHKF